VRTAHSLIGIGDVYLMLNQINKAEAAYSQALKIYDSVRVGRLSLGRRESATPG
jgi:predicted negative regulator of RcsB-dependent stress response